MSHTIGIHVAVALACVAVLRAEQPKAVVPAPSFSFQKVVQGASVTHEYVLRNDGAAPLRIEGVRLSKPLTLARLPAVIAPGQQVGLRVSLETTGIAGVFEGIITVVVNDPDTREIELTFTGTVAPLVEVSPMAAFYVAGPRGEGGRGVVEIINHTTEPLRILKVEHPTDRFTMHVDPIEEGRRYRLALSLLPQGPGGRAVDTVLVHTSSPARPVLRVAANTYLRERVYTFPDRVDFGNLRAADVKSSLGAQTLMIYQQGGSEFTVKLTTTLPIAVTAERGPRGDRWQATLALDPAVVQPGPLRGSIVVATNDPEFPELTVPVVGTILP